MDQASLGEAPQAARLSVSGAISTATVSPARPADQAMGQPLPAGVAQAAARWFALLQSGEASTAERMRWQQWLQADADHGRAWAHLQVVTSALPGFNTGGVAYRSLSPLPRTAAQVGRRRMLGVLAGVGTAVGATWMASSTPQWQQMAADYTTGTQRRRWTLPDGSDMLLGPGSSVALHFDASERRVCLLAGEALFTTAHPGGALGARPFVVETAHGRVRALGTRFTVRSDDVGAYVAVLEGAVELRPRHAQGAVLRLDAGQATGFTRSGWEVPQPVSSGDEAWSRGLLWADNQRLDDFLAELGRYRPGWLRVDPAVAGLRLSGVFPVGDGGMDRTDAVLSMLPGALPVQLRWRTRWWVVVEAAGAPGR